MAKTNPGDVLTSDWNPIIGCVRYSAGCLNCWYLDAIFPWQQRLGNIPAFVDPSQSYLFESRLTASSLKAKRGIVGIIQHGDLFFDGNSDNIINKVLDIVDEVASQKKPTPTYMLWTKRAERMGRILTRRYPSGVPSYLASSISVENRASLNRLEVFSWFSGRKIIVLEPLLERLSLSSLLNGVDWVILGSETGKMSRPFDVAWARSIRDEVKAAGIPFFIKQLGGSHGQPSRELDGRTWDEFPPGMQK